MTLRNKWARWEQGLYIYEALCDVSPILRAFSKATKPLQYPQQPYGLEDIHQNKVNEVIEDNWSGLTLSERIEEHKRKLNLSIKEEILKGIKRGDSLQNISRIISDKFDISYTNTMRLVRTEASRVMNEATLNNYKENGIKKYEYMAYLDSKTSKQCKSLDGKVFNIEDAKAGVNLPPMHPNCRSTIIPFLEN